ncbi:hypothetical protein G6M86_28235 (plasmid) [Agrobacterium tumefaciens]|uniref:Uncharacterized protein n=1 Tax=Agrobacterium tumefaciens TaxID=358 RepID=A0AAJ4N8L0_AGRTU|nr:hypothetical protein G6M86_28235 [Agrobacterium tumefaciens]
MKRIDWQGLLWNASAFAMMAEDYKSKKVRDAQPLSNLSGHSKWGYEDIGAFMNVFRVCDRIGKPGSVLSGTE